MAAFALTLLSQMLRVLGLSTAWQYAVYGIAIAAGMVISGDRIVGVLGGVLQRPGVRAFLGTGDDDSADPDERRDVYEEEYGVRSSSAWQGRLVPRQKEEDKCEFRRRMLTAAKAPCVAVRRGRA